MPAKKNFFKKKKRSTGITHTWNGNGETITCGDNATSTSTYYLYKIQDGRRKYLASYSKTTWGSENFSSFHVPEEGLTWKRSAAMAFSNDRDAKNLRNLLGLRKFKVERKIEVFEF